MLGWVPFYFYSCVVIITVVLCIYNNNNCKRSQYPRYEENSVASKLNEVLQLPVINTMFELFMKVNVATTGKLCTCALELLDTNILLNCNSPIVEL